MDEPGPVYTIGQVSDLLDVPTPTIRSWERRHDLRPDGHTSAGHRRYTLDDVNKLRRMRDELAAGRGAREAAAIARSLRSSTPHLLATALCAAAHRLDDAAINDVLDRARTLHGLPATVDLVLLPAMRELGRQWSVGECDVAHEHLATAAARTWLSNAGPAAPPTHEPVAVVLACAPEEQHTLALDALAVLLAHRGLRCLHLGARVPAMSLRTAVNDSRARALVLSCQLSSHRRTTIAALRAVEDTTAARYYAGAAFTTPASRLGVPGHYLGESVQQATDQLVAADLQSWS